MSTLVRMNRPALRVLAHLRTGLFLAVFGCCLGAALAVAKTAPEAAREHYEAAAKHAEQGALRAAVIELKNALQRDPDHADARLLLGEVYLQLGGGAGAEKELRAAIRLGEEPARVAVSLGQALLLQGRFDKILAEFSAEDVAPEMAQEILLLRADAHAGLGQAEAARAIYDQIARRDAAEPRVYVGLARLALAAGDLASAEAQAEEALARQPGLAEALLVQAEGRRLGGRPQAALTPFRTVLDAQPASPALVVRARLGLSAALVALGRDEEAEEEIAALRQTAPGLPLASYLEALIKLRQQDIAGARRLLDAAAPSLEDFVPAQFLSGIVHYAAGELESARAWLSRALNAQPDNLQARKLLGATLLRLGAVEEAATILVAAESQAPDDPQVLLLLGNAELRRGRAVEASTLLQRAAELAPQDPRVLSQLAISHIATGKGDEARAALNATLDLDEAASAIGYAMAFVHLRKGEFEDALRVVQDLRRRFPQSAVAANLEGGARVGLGQLDQAQSAFEAAVEFDRDYHEARANVAALSARRGDFAGAEAAYRAILEVDEKQVTALMGMAALADRRGDMVATRGWLGRAIEADPDAVQPSLALAEHQAGAGDAAAALAVLEGLAQRQPRHPQVLMALARFQRQAGQNSSAVETHRRLVEVSGDSTVARLLLAEAQLAAEDFGAARRSYEDLLKAAGDNPVVWNNLAWLYHHAGDAQAVAHAERALALAPDQPAVMDTLGWILLADEAQLERASGLLENAHRAMPASADIAYHYAVALHRTGKSAEARDFLQSLLEDAGAFSARAQAEELLRTLAR